LQFGASAAVGVTEQLRLMVTQAFTERVVISTFRGCWATGVGQSSADKNWGFGIHAWVTVGATNVVRGTLINNYKQPSSAGQWLDSGEGTIGRVIPDIACDPIIIQPGDFLVVELGATYYEAGGVALDSLGTRDSGGSILPDIGAGDAGNAHSVWLEYESTDVISDTPTVPFEDGEISIPIAHIEVTLKDGNTKVFAEVDLNDRDDYYHGFKQANTRHRGAYSRRDPVDKA
jgi:hypothetical protein